MTSLLIVGAGGHGVVVADAAAARWDTVEFLDDGHDAGATVGHWTVRGGVDAIDNLKGDIIVAIGDNARRQALLKSLSEHGLVATTVLHAAATVSDLAKIGPGSFIAARAVVGPGVYLGCGSIVNTSATVDHDCQIGDCVHVSPGAHLGGGVRVGDRSWIGIGASVKHGIVIGEDVVVGAGASVVCDLEDGVVAKGVPARADV